MELFGQITGITETQKISENFTKKELVIETIEQYSQVFKIEFANKTAEILDGFNVGDSVKVAVNLRGKKSVGADGRTVYFMTLAGWKLSKF